VPFGLSDDQWTSLLRGLARGEYHLLLGAGASMDSVDRLGRSLPSARQFVSRIAGDFSIPADPATLSFGRAFDAAKSRRAQDGRKLETYLAEEFLGCEPSDWYEYVISTRWRAIWTLNIDDVVPNAYANASWAKEQKLKALSWTDPFARQDEGANELQLLYLHGSADKLASKGLDEIVFGIVEYLRASEHRHAWHHILSDEFQSAPFIVIGATLAEEWDLAEILRRGNHAQELHGRPSLVVLKHIDELQREEFEQWGLHPVEGVGSEFFERVSADLREYEAEFAKLTPGPGNLLPSEAVRFLQQFHQLTADRSVSSDPHHDLYSGHEPRWDDIVKGRDARFPIANKVTDYTAARALEKNAQTVTAITGPPFSGKSVALLRAGRELLKRDVDVFVFDADQRIDVPATTWWLANSGPTVLLFDGMADQSPEIYDLSQACQRAGVTMTVVGSERAGRRSRLYSNLPPEILASQGLFEVRSLTNGEISLLVDKLKSARRLGLISSKSKREQEEYFKRDGRRQLVEGMARLESGRGFIDRLTRQFREISDPALQNAYGVACIVNVFGYAIPIPVLCSSAGISTDTLLAACRPEGQLSEVIELLGARARPRHRRLASLVVDDVLSTATRYELSHVVARNLAPYVTRRTIHQRTLHHRIVREMMNHRVLADWLGAEKVDQWYLELIDSYGWNARFWEQRALAAVRLDAYDRAESYAEHAVVTHRDSFTLTTLGTVLLRKARSWLEPWSESSREYYWRGVEALREAIKRGQGRLELPYSTFFSYTLDLATSTDAVLADLEVKTEWNRWLSEAQLLPLFGHAELRHQLDEFSRRWLELQANRDNDARESATP
jgi:hypothetical protein